MAEKIEKSSIHDFVTGEIVTEEILDTIFEIFRVAVNDVDAGMKDKYDKQQVDNLIANLAGAGRTNETVKGIADALIAHKSSIDHDGRYYTKAQIDGFINAINQLKADITYVDQKIADIQNGQIADDAVTTPKIRDGAVTTAKIAPGAIKASVIDTSSVPTNATMAQRISEQLEGNLAYVYFELDGIKAWVGGHDVLIAQTNSRIDGLQYNTDLYTAKADILSLQIQMDILTLGNMTGVDNYTVIESLRNTNDLIVTGGIFDGANRKIYLP